MFVWWFLIFDVLVVCDFDKIGMFGKWVVVLIGVVCVVVVGDVLVDCVYVDFVMLCSVWFDLFGIGLWMVEYIVMCVWCDLDVWLVFDFVLM